MYKTTCKFSSAARDIYVKGNRGDMEDFKQVMNLFSRVLTVLSLKLVQREHIDKISTKSIFQGI